MMNQNISNAEKDEDFDKPASLDEEIENPFLKKLKIVFGKTEDFLQLQNDFYTQREELKRIKGNLCVFEGTLREMEEDKRKLEFKGKEDKKGLEEENGTLKEELRAWKEKVQTSLDELESLKKRIMKAIFPVPMDKNSSNFSISTNPDQLETRLPLKEKDKTDGACKISKNNGQSDHDYFKPRERTLLTSPSQTEMTFTVTRNELRQLIKEEMKLSSNLGGIIEGSKIVTLTGPISQIPCSSSNLDLNMRQETSYSGCFEASGTRKRKKADDLNDSSNSNNVPNLKTQFEKDVLAASMPSTNRADARISRPVVRISDPTIGPKPKKESSSSIQCKESNIVDSKTGNDSKKRNSRSMVDSPFDSKPSSNSKEQFLQTGEMTKDETLICRDSNCVERFTNKVALLKHETQIHGMNITTHQEYKNKEIISITSATNQPISNRDKKIFEEHKNGEEGKPHE